MEFIDGEDLARKIAREGRLRVSQTMTIAIQCLKALDYLHRSQFVHRDVSPDNLMLTKDVDGEDLIKVIDLGIAKQLEDDLNLTQEGLFLGKMKYASPEQFGSRGGELDGRSDLYSFGVVLYEVLTGVHPFTAENQQAMMAAHLFLPPGEFAASDPQGRIPEALRMILQRALAKDPNDRFQTAREMAEAIAPVSESWEEVEPSPAEEPAPTVIEPLAPPLASRTTQERLDRQFEAVPTAPPIRAVDESEKDPSEAIAATRAAKPVEAAEPVEVAKPERVLAPAKPASRTLPEWLLPAGGLAALFLVAFTIGSWFLGGRDEQEAPPDPLEASAPQLDETPAVLGTIQSFVEAHVNLDLQGLRSIWPALAGGRLDAVQESFSGAESIDMSIDDCTVLTDGATATADCLLRQSYRPKSGTPQSVERTVQFRLRKGDSGWVIEDY